MIKLIYILLIAFVSSGFSLLIDGAGHYLQIDGLGHKFTQSLSSHYIRADGMVIVKGGTNGDCGSVGNCMSITMYGGETFNAGDTIVLCDEGGFYVSGFNTPSGGTIGNPVVITGIITGTSVVVDDEYINLERMVIK